jgi:hypothetical protein
MRRVLTPGPNLAAIYLAFPFHDDPARRAFFEPASSLISHTPTVADLIRTLRRHGSPGSQVLNDICASLATTDFCIAWSNTTVEVHDSYSAISHGCDHLLVSPVIVQRGIHNDTSRGQRGHRCGKSGTIGGGCSTSQQRPSRGREEQSEIDFDRELGMLVYRRTRKGRNYHRTKVCPTSSSPTFPRSTSVARGTAVGTHCVRRDGGWRATAWAEGLYSASRYQKYQIHATISALKSCGDDEYRHQGR